MRKSGWMALCAAVALASSAQATVISQCAGGCFTDLSGLLLVDYTVPSDGRTYRWDLWSDSAHPDVLINLSSPNEIWSYGTVSDGNGAFHDDFTVPNTGIVWNESQAPGHTTIYTKSLLASFNDCASTTPAGVLCATTYNVWGNGAFLTVNTPDRVGLYFTSTAIPEPAGWALMLLGFFGLGAAMRRSRRLHAAPPIGAA